MADVTRPALTVINGAPEEDPFILAVARALLAAGFPPERISWLDLPAPAALELSAAMGPSSSRSSRRQAAAGASPMST